MKLKDRSILEKKRSKTRLPLKPATVCNIYNGNR